jgi:hypothetical protein
LQKQYEKKPDVGLRLSTPLDLVLRLGKGSRKEIKFIKAIKIILLTGL